MFPEAEKNREKEQHMELQNTWIQLFILLFNETQFFFHSFVLFLS